MDHAAVPAVLQAPIQARLGVFTRVRALPEGPSGELHQVHFPRTSRSIRGALVKRSCLATPARAVGDAGGTGCHARTIHMATSAWPCCCSLVLATVPRARTRNNSITMSSL